jgi:phytoene desaturase
MPRDSDQRGNSPSAIVIGAGFGGIAAALRARRLGYEVQLLERQPTLGGRARVFRQHGFTFDAGPTVITAPQLFEELFALFGERMAEHVELLPVRPWYRILFSDQRHFDYGSTAEEVRAAVVAFAPDDAHGYDRFMRRSKALFELGFNKYGAQPFDTLSSMARALPGLLRLDGLRSVHSLVRGCIRDESLRRVFSLQPLLLGGHPFRTSGVYALIPYLEQRWGVWFPRGGTGAMVTALEELMVRTGIRIRAGCTVSRIRIRDGRAVGVDLSDGTELSADIVIANADAPQVHAVLQPASAPHRKRVDKMNYSMGLFVLCFGTDRSWPDVAHHTIILGERWQALLDEIFDGDRVPDDPSLYLHRPAATDSSLQPPGHDGFYVLAPVPNLRAGIDWDRAAPLLRDRVIQLLEQRVLPGLSGHIVTERLMTPRDFEQDYLSRHGAGFSVAPTLLQSATFRFHNLGPVPGLYLVGAGTHPGAGVPGVLTSAKVVERLLQARAVR